MEQYEKTLDTSMEYQGKIINLRVDQVELPNGKTSRREVVEHPGGVCVAAITENKELLLVRQYRAGSKSVLLELPAGKLERGEKPYDCGYRELQEETGYKAKEFFEAASFYSSPGFTDEVIYLYIAKGLEPSVLAQDEDEFIETEAISLEQLSRMVKDGQIHDAKTIIGILLAQQYM